MKNRVIDVLKNHFGRENAITTREIARKVHSSERHDTQPAVRKAIREAILDSGLPVASDGSGYYLIRDFDEMTNYLEDLESRARAIRARGDAVLHNFVAQFQANSNATVKEVAHG